MTPRDAFDRGGEPPARPPGPEDVAEALRQGRPPSEILGEPAGGEAPPPDEPAVPADRAGAPAEENQ